MRRGATLLLGTALALLGGGHDSALASETPPRVAPGVTASQPAPEHLAAALLAETNRVRQAHGRRPLRGQRELHAAADDQAAFMALTLTVRHSSYLPAQATPAERVRRRGVQPQGVAENVAAVSLAGGTLTIGPEQIAAILVQQWMDSPGHRANLLDPQFTHFGGGIRFARIVGDQWCAFGAQVFTVQRGSLRRST